MAYHVFLWLWSGLVQLFGPFLIWNRIRKGLEHPERYKERYGITNENRPDAPIIWFHGASVGESLSILPLIEKMTTANPDWFFLITTTTLAAQKVVSTRIPKNAIHQFIPFDAIPWVNTFFNHWQPKAIFFVESEIWPNLIKQATQRNLPITLLNARLSASSFQNWYRIKKISAQLWGAFAKIYTQSDEFTERFHRLGAKHATTLGNIKLLAKPLPFNEEELERWKNLIGNRPCWVVASTHKGEEQQIFDIHLALKKKFSNLLTILAPRHIERCDEILSLNRNVKISRFSKECLKNEDILLVDAMAKLGVFYRLSPIAFIGGSLIPQGGHNPLEPAMVGAFPLWGPYFFNVNDMMYLFEDFLCQKIDKEEIINTLCELLENPEKALTLAKNLQQRINTHQENISQKINDIIPDKLCF